MKRGPDHGQLRDHRLARNYLGLVFVHVIG
jgi:hypothetical protein